MKIRTILGCMELGRFNSATLETCKEILSVFYKQGYSELDTAFMYCDGKSEEFLGQIEICRDKSRTLMATKANPISLQGLQYEGVINQLNTSLNRLQRDSVELFYLHAPDHKAPITETLRAVNELHKAGKFLELGVSNYAAWQVAEIYYLCKMNGWVLPTVYQGMYNAITRSVEKELFPCLQKFGIRFYAYNPLAGGLLTGKYKYEDNIKEQSSGRFSDATTWGKMYRKRYWTKDNFEQLENIKKALDASYGPGKVSLTEASLRWMYHHSKLSPQAQDGVILGAGSVTHLSENLAACQSEPLLDSVVAAFDEAWEATKHHCPDYMR